MIGYIRHHPIRFDSIRSVYIPRVRVERTQGRSTSTEMCLSYIYIQGVTKRYPILLILLCSLDYYKYTYNTFDDSLLIYQGTIIYLIFELKDFFISLQLSFSPFVPIKKKLPLV